MPPEIFNAVAPLQAELIKSMIHVRTEGVLPHKQYLTRHLLVSLYHWWRARRAHATANVKAFHCHEANCIEPSNPYFCKRASREQYAGHNIMHIVLHCPLSAELCDFTLVLDERYKAPSQMYEELQRYWKCLLWLALRGTARSAWLRRPCVCHAPEGCSEYSELLSTSRKTNLCYVRFPLCQIQDSRI